MKSIHTFVVLAYKESIYLEECIKSVLNQKYKSVVILATSTPNDFISKLAQKYNLEVKVNQGKKGIGYDFDFAIHCGKTELVTVAHQDDIYDYNYANEMVKGYKKKATSIILFPDYYEIRNGKNTYNNLNLIIKKILLLPLRIKCISKFKFIKRSALRFGDAISCPAVTFVKKNIPEEVFSTDLKCNIDWYAWEKLSHRKGEFYYIPKPLMGHRIYGESTTSEVLKENGRTKEDLEILKKFWPTPIAKLIAKVYANSERSNNVK